MSNGDNLNLTLNDSVLNYRKTLQSQADASFYISREDLHAVLTGQAKMADLVKAKKAKIIGNGAKLEEIIACLDNFDLWVNIVTPKLMSPSQRYFQSLEAAFIQKQCAIANNK